MTRTFQLFSSLSALTCSAGASLAQPGFAERTISTNADRARSVFAADVDGDGDMDALSASLFDDKIAWYENDGASPPAFTERIITTDAGAPFSVHAADLDGDGDTDVMSAAGFFDQIVWYENNGATPPAFTERVLTITAEGGISVFAADLDGDGDNDILSASINDDTVEWFQNNGATPPFFLRRTISIAADGVSSVFAADVDDDGDIDVLAAASIDDEVIWYENNGALPPSFSKHIISSTADGARSVYAIDIDGDDDLDVLSASRDNNTIAWHENDGMALPGFTERVISTTADLASAVFAIDLDNDGDNDVLSASANDDKIVWYENDGAVSPGFTARVLSTNADAAISVHAADMDGDGDHDVLSASSTDDKIAWYESDLDPFACPADLNGDGFTGSTDMAILLGSWGVNAFGDLNGDGITASADLAILLGSWGSCQ